MFGYGIFFAIMTLIGAIALVRFLAEQKRQKGVKLLADQLGLEHTATLSEVDYLRFQRFPIASEGRQRTAFGSIVAEANGLRMVLFDYRYVKGSGKHRRTYHFGILMVQNPNFRIPSFTLEIASWQSRFATFFGGQDIVIDQDVEFSKRYRLQGAEPERIQAFMTSPRRQELMLRQDECVQGVGDCFIIYRRRKHLQPQEIQPWMSRGLALAEAFSEAEKS